MDTDTDRVILALKAMQTGLEDQAQKLQDTDKKQGLKLINEAFRYQKLIRKLKNGILKLEVTDD